MKITIKNVKYSEFASQETYCFEATVYIDGKREFIASNDGHGGCDNYHALNGGSQSKVWDRVNEINEELKQERVDVDGTGKHFISNSLELVIGDLMNNHLALKDIKSKMRRQILALDKTGQVIQYKADPKRVSDAKRTAFEATNNVTVLNGKTDAELKTLLKDWLNS